MRDFLIFFFLNQGTLQLKLSVTQSIIDADVRKETVYLKTKQNKLL